MPDAGTYPRGLGTPEVESFTSVVRRLAEQESRTVEAFLDVNVVEPARALGRRMPNFIATSLTEAVNGASGLTRVLVDGVSSAFALPDLDRATLLSTAGELFTRRDFSPIRRWCPVCLEHEPYDRLIWTFAEVRHCPRHLVALVAHARCGHIQRPWALHTSAHTCAVCDLTLVEAEITKVTPDPLTAAYAEVIANLQQGVVLTKGAITAGARALMEQEGDRRAGLARRARLSWRAAAAALAGSSALELGTLARLIAFGGWSIGSLLSHGVVHVAEAQPRPKLPNTARRDLATMERVLHSEGSKPRDERRTLQSIAHEFGLSASYPARHFPALVRPWSDPLTRRHGRRRIA